MGNSFVTQLKQGFETVGETLAAPFAFAKDMVLGTITTGNPILGAVAGAKNAIKYISPSFTRLGNMFHGDFSGESTFMKMLSDSNPLQTVETIARSGAMDSMKGGADIKNQADFATRLLDSRTTGTNNLMSLLNSQNVAVNATSHATNQLALNNWTRKNYSTPFVNHLLLESPLASSRVHAVSKSDPSYYHTRMSLLDQGDSYMARTAGL